MERPYTGLTALIKVNSVAVGYLNSVDLNFEKDITEIIQFGAEYREKVPAIKNWTASVEGTVAFAAGESQHKLYQAFESGELIELIVMLDSMTNFTGQALVSSLSISAAPDDSMSISAEFEGSGGMVFTLPHTFLVGIASGVGGTTTPAGTVRVVALGNLDITVVPSAGKVGDKYYDGATDLIGTAVPANNVIAITNITEDHQIRVTFKDETTGS